MRTNSPGRRQDEPAEGAQPANHPGGPPTAFGVNLGTSLNTAALATPMPSASSICPRNAAATDFPPKISTSEPVATTTKEN